MSPPDLPTSSMRVTGQPSATEVAQVIDLALRAERADGAAPLNEQALLNLRTGGAQVRHVFGVDDAELVAYGQIDMPEAAQDTATGSVAEPVGECVVDPSHRQCGWGAAVAARLLEEAAGSAVLLWSHTGHPGVQRLARKLGFESIRELWQLQRPLGADADVLPEARVPDGIQVRTFVVGHDEQAWLRVNRRAFAEHPEQGGMTADDLSQRIDSDWFDAGGFFVAERTGRDDGRLVGFHWTKLQPVAGGPIGEVYVVGVDPDEQGSGLGSALTLIGLHHLRDRGATDVLLYVEADNGPALRVYERLGFAHVGSDTQYRHPGLR